MIGLIAGGLSAQPSIAAAAPGSCLGFASRGCLVQGAERGGGEGEKASKFGGETVVLLLLYLRGMCLSKVSGNCLWGHPG